MENTAENKSKFFALYLNQKVYRRIDVSYDNEYVTSDLLHGDIFATDSVFFIDFGFLSLRSISSLTDEEAKGIGFEDAESLNRCYNSYGNDSFFSYFIRQKEIDMLRSLSILIPWMDLSVEDILDFGWAKGDNTHA